MGEATNRATREVEQREAIVDAALRRFLDHGYEDTSLEDVCADLGISLQTLHRHFATKEQLALDFQHAALARFRAALDERTADEPVADWWRRFVQDLADRKTRWALSREQHRLVQSVAALNARRVAIIREFEDLLTAAIAAEQPEAGAMRARLSALVLLGATEAAFDEWVYDAQDRPLRDLAMHALDVALAEFPPP